MSSETQILAILRTVFRDADFTGRARRWHRVYLETTWYIDVDKPPHSNRLPLELGIDAPALRPPGWGDPRKANDCGIKLFSQRLPLAPDLSLSSIKDALDLDILMEDDERHRVVEHIARAIVSYINEHTTLDELRSAYQAGDFKGSAIFKRAREALES